MGRKERNSAIPGDAYIANLRFITLSQGKSHFLALIDTGAQTQVCGALVGNQLLGQVVDGPDLSLKGAFAGSQKIIMWKQCIVSINEVEVPVCFAVLPCLGSLIILGMTFLEKTRAIVDISMNMIQIYGRWVPLESKQINSSSDIKIQTMLYLISALSQDDMQQLDAILERATQLSIGGKVRLRRLFLEFSEIWADGDLGDTKVVQHVIRLTTDIPVVGRPFARPCF
jgi:hypothetical protein